MCLSSAHGSVVRNTPPSTIAARMSLEKYTTLAVALPARETTSAPYSLRWGGCSRPASGKANEDFYALRFPEREPSGRREVVVALADGVSADGGARPVIEAIVLGLISDYYATPPQWSVARALDRLLRAANDWVWTQNIGARERDGVTAAV